MPEPTSRRAPGQLSRDAQRSRRRLLAAALDVFSAKGYAGARVQDIADRAGMNKQLISYYFGGKEGIYRELQRCWRAGHGGCTDAEALDELAERQLRRALDDPRMTRLQAWHGLAGNGAPESPEPTESADSPRAPTPPGLPSCACAGREIDPGLDPAAVELVLRAAVAAPVVLPHVVRELFGLDPADPEFERRYARQLRAILRKLAAD